MTVIVEENPTQVIVTETGVEVITVGIAGADGVGVPIGGATGQILAKASNTNYDTEWVDPADDAVWGNITGTLSNQTDLQSVLNGKQPLATVLTNTTASFTSALEAKLNGIEAGADVTDATNVNAAGAVMNSDYTPAHSILVQQSGTGSPTALAIGNNTLVGRLSGGGSDIDDLSTSEVRTLLSINNVDNTSDLNKPISTATQTALNGKQPLATVLTNTTASFTTAQETKLSGIAAGAEVNVNADWNATSGDAQILNKPTIPSITGLVPYTGATGDVTLDAFDIQAQEMTVGNGAVGHNPLLTFDGQNRSNTITQEQFVSGFTGQTNSRLKVLADDNKTEFVIGNISSTTAAFLQLFSAFTTTASVSSVSGGSSFMVMEAKESPLFGGLGGTLLLTLNSGSDPADGNAFGSILTGAIDSGGVAHTDKGISFVADGWPINKNTKMNIFRNGGVNDAVLSIGGDDVVTGNPQFTSMMDLVWQGQTQGFTLHVDVSADEVSTYNFRHRGVNLGFYGATTVTQSTGWNVTNVTTDKGFDANATTVNELADVLGTLINQLKTYGLLGA
jgi:hypothetical protein